jgi:hypothetical protein
MDHLGLAAQTSKVRLAWSGFVPDPSVSAGTPQNLGMGTENAVVSRMQVHKSLGSQPSIIFHANVTYVQEEENI